MYPILKAEKLADKIYLMVVEAPRVARACEPGEFVIVKMGEEGERIPLTICDFDRQAGTITIVFQTVGASTEKMSTLKAGDAFHDFVGPLGNPSEFIHEDVEELKKKKYLFVAGGVGAAPVYPQVKWMHEHGIDVDVIVGSKTKDLLILTEEMEKAAGNLYITTDDGSFGIKGMVTGVIEDLVETGTQVRCLCCNRTDDHDEICLPADEKTGDSDDCQPEPDHGRWNRYVWCLSCHRRRPGQICLRRRTGV